MAPTMPRTRLHCSNGHWPRAWLSFRVRRFPRRDGSPTRCACASPRHRPTGLTKESPGFAARSTCSRRADRMGVSAAEQAVLDRIDESRLVELTTSLVRTAGQNPPGDEAATVHV